MIEAFFALQQPGLCDNRLDVFFLVTGRRVGRQSLQYVFGGRRDQGGCFDCFGDVANIFAAIAARRKRHDDVMAFQPSQPDTGSEYVHLPASVIHVVLAMYRVARSDQQVADRRAVGCMTAMPNVQWPGRVSRDEFEQNLRGSLFRQQSVARAGVEDGRPVRRGTLTRSGGN